MARDAHADLVELECRAPASTTAHRIRARTGTASDATVEIAERLAETADPWPEATIISTTATVSDSVSAAMAAWRDAPSGC